MFELHNKFYDKIDDILTPVDFVKKGKKEELANVPAVFDIETSSFYLDKEKAGCMYAWVFGINGKCIRGRYWWEFDYVLNRVAEYYGLNRNRRLIIYVHNLAYEFQWFKKRYKWEAVFSVDNRKPVYAITDFGIEFRCSYILSGYSLAKVGENLLKYKVSKLVGDLDYKLIRTSITPLNDIEWGYILNDGLVVMSFIQEELEREGNIKELPLTKTGYVRKLCRKNTISGGDKVKYNCLIRKLKMTLDDFTEFMQAYAGGFTHANHNYVGKTISGVSSFDFTSSYPAVMVAEMFPMSAPIEYTPTNTDDFNYHLSRYCCMFEAEFDNIRASVDFEHYISKSKCSLIKDYCLDNGRVVNASKLRITLTELDYKIIKQMYKWDSCKIAHFKYMEKFYLPKPLIKTILTLYKNKTSLKGVAGKEIEYMVSKGMLNGIYGMCVTNPCKDEILYDNMDGWGLEKCDTATLLDKYNKSTQRFLYYAWGVWVSAYSRYNLFRGILEFRDDYLYSDTDSLKVLNKDNHMDFINSYNEEVTNKIKKCLNRYYLPTNLACPKTIEGVEKPLGVWDYEGTYSKFKTLGAKRYMYVDNKGLHITIAGVSKQAGKEYLLHTYKTIDNIFDNFKESLTFPAEYLVNENDTECIKNGSGKLLHTYIDYEQNGFVTDYLGNTYEFKELSAVHLEPTSYNLSLDSAFLKYITNFRNGEML